VYGDGQRISSRVYCGGENGVMGSLEARRVAEGDRTSFWQAVVVDLSLGGSAWRIRPAVRRPSMTRPSHDLRHTIATRNRGRAR
jgi:hypothetical protein